MSPNSSSRRRLLFVPILVVLMLAFLEVAARTYASIASGAPFFAPQDALQETSYRELRGPREREIRSDDRHFDILVLAGSVLQDRYAPFEAALREELSLRSRREVRVHSLTRAAHNSRDSLLKYRQLGEQRFDLVVVYHGINDLRANQISEAEFRDDYSHMEWYRRVNWLSQNQDLLHWTAVPYVLNDVRIAFEKLTGRYRPAAEGALERDVGFEEVTKTTPGFRSNLEAILSLARERGDRVLLMTYAWYVPDGYSEKAFNEKRIDYALHGVPTEVWGSPQGVARGLRAHNDVVHALAREHPDALFVDQEALIPREGIHWNDVCHLTVRGTLAFARFIAEAIESAGLLTANRAPQESRGGDRGRSGPPGVTPDSSSSER